MNSKEILLGLMRISARDVVQPLMSKPMQKEGPLTASRTALKSPIRTPTAFQRH